MMSSLSIVWDVAWNGPSMCVVWNGSSTSGMEWAQTMCSRMCPIQCGMEWVQY